MVELPTGTDPADLIQQEGGGAIEAAIGRAAPFVRFRVERVLATGDDTSPEGRDRMIGELRPVFEGLPPSAMRMDLTRLVSGRLGLSEGLAETLLAARTGQGGGGEGLERRTGVGALAAQPAGGGALNGASRDGHADVSASGASKVLSAREDTERAFLALCIATPIHGQQALAEVEIGEVFTSELLRRAAGHLKMDGLAEPLKGVDAEDRELVSLLAELTVEAGRWPAHEGSHKPAMLEVQQLQLRLAAIDRQIHAARAQGAGEVSELARARGKVKREFDRAQERALAQSGSDTLV